MKAFLGCVLASAAAAAVGASACTSSSSNAAANADAGRILACPPATDAGVAAAIDAGIVVTITSPTEGQKFKSTDRVPFSGTGYDPKEGSITDRTRTIWNIGDAVKGVNPDGEGPEDMGGPYAPGSYVVRFDVSNKACVTGAAAVNITVE